MICPTGKSAKSCPSPGCKNKSFRVDPKHLYKRAIPCPHRGAYHGRHETLARDAVDAGGIEDERTDADGKAVWSWRPTLASSCGEKSAATVANKPDHRGERGISRKPLCRGCPGASAEPVCSCAPLLPLRMRPRVQRAPGIPCALWLMEGQVFEQNSGATSRGCTLTSRRRLRGAPLVLARTRNHHPTANHCGPNGIPGSRYRAPGMTR